MTKSIDNNVLATGRAFAIYSLVPYLGIVFCPGAVLMGGLGVVRSYYSPEIGGRNSSYLIIVIGSVVLGGQLLLWWLLYKVPEWARGF
jgi:hypothetical protein